MDVRLQPHNMHWRYPDQFRELDPHLSRLQEMSLVYRFPLLDGLPRTEPGIYAVTGGRQIGKTTLLKQYMADLQTSGHDPECIIYLPGEVFDDHHALVAAITDCLGRLEDRPGPIFLLLDEVTYIAGWDRGVKYLADAGLLRNVILLLTGSDCVLIREARMRFPGRRGRADQPDFHLFPLTFAEVVALRRGLSHADVQELSRAPSDVELSRLENEFERYLAHGGYLTAINELERDHSIRRATFTTYGDWIRGDVLKRGKHEHFLREILDALSKRAGTQITWNNLVADLSIDHPATVADYVALLARMDAVIVQQALREDKLQGAPKKARKVYFSDPFIAHAIRAWLRHAEQPYEDIVEPLLADPERVGTLVEACAVAHFKRFFPTYYIKGVGEVDIAYVEHGQFWPVEIKWTRQIRSTDLKQLGKYPRGLVCTKAGFPASVHGVAAKPLVQALLELGPSPLVSLSEGG